MASRIRHVLAIFLGILVTIACIVTNAKCGNDSSKCTATWWNTSRYTENDLALDHDRGCFDMTLAGETMFGDTINTWSSIYFAIPIAYITEKNFWLVFISLWIASTSFVFHATYSKTANMYDVVGLRLFSVVVFIELFIALEAYKANSTIPRRIVLFFGRGLSIFTIGYVGYLQWDNNNYRDRAYTYAWASIPLGFILLYLLFRHFNKTRDLGISIGIGVFSLICFIVGSVMLIRSDMECGDELWIEHEHFYGHLFAGIGMGVIASMDIWTQNTDYSILENKELPSMI